jgi:hypothetical protein
MRLLAHWDGNGSDQARLDIAMELNLSQYHVFAGFTNRDAMASL